jgi:hypothetical protein
MAFGTILFLEFQFVDKLFVTRFIFAFQVAKQSAAIADHLQQTTAGMVILFVGLQMTGNLFDLSGKDSDLHFWGTSVILMRLELANQGVFLFFIEHWVLILWISARVV